MDFDNLLPKEASRIPRKPERPYISSLKSSPMETRRRLLRTYSKRISSTESTEPAPKRQCFPRSHTASIQDEEIHLNPTDPEHSTTDSESKPSLPLPPTKKGTITAYFSKRKTQPPVAILSSDPLVDMFPDPDTTTVSPPSPPDTPVRRSARRLKTRVVTRRIAESEDGEEEQETRDDEKHIGRIRDINVPSDAHAPLLEAKPNALNLNKGTSSTRPEGGKPRENRRQDAKMPLVQTTLSLSMSEAHYTECKECGMLYNHLHETDVKYHARRHAALRRAKARTDARRDEIE
ncbi:hypothetical protein GGR58DRAFT_95601 [Xylaria digitata]|nr:hypothetical protein GGR58DRAFT_95601 [Xylaria digitata]